MVSFAAAVFWERNLFEMAGWMIGRSFLHGGLGSLALSLSVVTMLNGGSSDIATSALTLQDCRDLDHRETIAFVSNVVKSSHVIHQCTTMLHVFVISRIIK